MESRQCKRCSSTDLDYTKHIYKRKTNDELIFHCMEKCNNCGFNHFIPRDRFAFEKTKDKEWVKSPAVKRLQSQSSIFGEDL